MVQFGALSKEVEEAEAQNCALTSRHVELEQKAKEAEATQHLTVRPPDVRSLQGYFSTVSAVESTQGIDVQAEVPLGFLSMSES